MKNALCALALMIGVAGHADAAGFDADLYLAKDKTIIGLGVPLVFESFGIDLDLAFIYVNDDADRAGFSDDDSFVGNLLGVHLVYRPVVTGRAEGRVGLGFDYWALWGINGDEYKMGIPVFAEGRYFIDQVTNVHLQVRTYLVASDGLGLGEDFDGEEGPPVLVTIGIGGDWK